MPRGAFYALLGPSGCGKTTTLRMIGGFEEPTDGRVFLGGDDVTERPPYKRDVNTVFQSYALFPHLSVEKNVALRARAEQGRQGRGPHAHRRGARAGAARPPRQAQARPALRRPAAARRARPRARQPPARPAARRAARRARPAPAQAAPDRAQAHPAGRRHHLRARHARPGGGHDDGRHDRGDARRPDRAGRRRRRPLRAPPHGVRGELPRRLEPDRRQARRHPGLASPRSRRTTARACTSPPTASARTTPTRSASACGPRRSRCARPATAPRPTARRTRCAAPSWSPPSSASRSSTWSGRAGGEELTVFAQNLDGSEPDSFGPGREVRLTWNPHHTFVVGKEQTT